MHSRKLTRVEKRLRSTVSENIRWILDAWDLTVDEFSNRAKVSKSHVFNILNGTSSASVDLIARIATAFELEPSELLE